MDSGPSLLEIELTLGSASLGPALFRLFARECGASIGVMPYIVEAFVREQLPKSNLSLIESPHLWSILFDTVALSFGITPDPENPFPVPTVH